ncbi:DNA adenine methylase [Mannheimia sp. AT1]|uniref:site-specific DNA-methyltransferase (adenine-specific) n=1 Tax=Mannheimia cairinae TaxID=3025936 RepID=A0ABT5MQR5_9PAST|nr:DNA adenine methylase [Mannheimia cairinae]MDD0823821.1 DNA adenine methylase [Mannheimia cairinae]MDD0825137.1 DNA adenine methylase [Mannheimia cairinae]
MTKTYDKKSINSPFRYAGGKFYARKLILECIPKHSVYIEPFVGGGSIFFAKDKVEYNILNDIDPDLINTYLIIKNRPNDLIDFLKDEKALKERHHWYKNEFSPKDELEKAARWYYLNRTSYSGIMNPKNCYWGYGDKYSMRPENWGNSILKTSSKLQGVEFNNLDFEIIIDNAPDNAFLFIDPPYFNADQDKFYTYSFNKEDHYRLKKCLYRNKDRLKFLITYDNSEEVRELYDWANSIVDKEWNYTINRTDDQTKNKIKEEKRGSRYKGKEIFITNYHINHSNSQIDLDI